MAAKSYRISAPFLSDEDREQVTRKGGLSGQESSNTARAMLVGLQRLPIYGGTVDPAVVAERRRRNKAARKSRRINRRAAQR